MASTYTVASGDTMWQIANARGITLDALIAANPQVQNPEMIQVGQVLNLPVQHAPPQPPNNPPIAQPMPNPPGRPADTPVPQPPPPAGARTYKTVGYFTNWGIYGRNYQPQDVPGDHITHILYSFANVRPSGEVFLTDTYADLEKHYPSDPWDDPGENAYGCIKQLFLLKKKHRHMKTLLSIGGWTYSSNFAAPAATAEGRRTFAKSAVGLLADLGFDGIDIDWEYPQNDAEARNFVLLLEETRKELRAFSQAHLGGKQLLLTVAAPCGATNYSKLRIADMDRYLDFWNLMCYDFAGSWDSMAGHQANVFPSQQNPTSTPFNADSAIRAYMAGGVQPAKIVFGLPLYGRAFENTKGPGHSFQGTGEGSWENGVWDYKALPHAGATEHSDPQLLASWSYSPAQGKMVSYDTPEIATRKAQYIKDKRLGGGMWWELSGDHPVSHPRSLVKTTVQAFGGPAALDRSENTLTYPTSKYNNVRNGFK